MSKTGMVTYTGKEFDFMNPRPEDICIEDIAHHLAMICRYQGAVREFYSVAEHCVRASYLSVGDPLANLLHDAAEAYIGDIIKPQKHLLYFDDDQLMRHFEAVENNVLLSIMMRLFTDNPVSWLEKCKSAGVKQADRIMLVTEIRDLMPESNLFGQWIKDIQPHHIVIYPWDWRQAECEFLRRYKELTT